MNITIQRQKKIRLCKVCGVTVDRNAPAVYCSKHEYVRQEKEKERCKKYRVKPEVIERDKNSRRKRKDSLLVYAFSGNEHRCGYKS